MSPVPNFTLRPNGATCPPRAGQKPHSQLIESTWYCEIQCQLVVDAQTMRLCGRLYCVAGLILLQLIASAADIVDRLPRPVTETASGRDGERVVAD